MKSIQKIINSSEIIFQYRDDSVGDLGVIGQILDGKCFDIERWHQGRVARAFYSSIIKNNLRPLIIDAGANIGAASVFFNAVYPMSKIVAIEPEKNNLSVLKLNVLQIDCDIYEGALGNKAGTSFLQDPGLSDWGFRCGVSGEYPVDVTTVDKIIDNYNSFVPFIIKIDIEGGEEALFGSDDEWFQKFAVIIFETHDWMLPFKAISSGLIKQAAKGEFDMLFRGENLFFFNHKFLLNFHKPF